MNNLNLLTVLFRTKNSLQDIITKDLNKYNLTISHFGILELLYHKGPSRIQDICEKLLVPNSSMSYQIEQLEKKGLIEREILSTDKRNSMISISKNGFELIENIFPEHKKLIDRIFDFLENDEKKVLYEILKRISLNTRGINL